MMLITKLTSHQPKTLSKQHSYLEEAAEYLNVVQCVYLVYNWKALQLIFFQQIIILFNRSNSGGWIIILNYI